MKLYCNETIVVARYDDATEVPADAHPGCDLIIVADDFGLGRFGPAPEDGGFDDRPHARPALPLDQIKAQLRRQVDMAAEAERLNYITGGAGQAMTYSRKVEEARACLAAAEPAPQDYPLLAATIGIDGADVVAVAQLVIAMDAQWTQIGAAIEAVRLGSKAAIDAADDEAAARAAAASVAWPQP